MTTLAWSYGPSTTTSTSTTSTSTTSTTTTSTSTTGYHPTNYPNVYMVKTKSHKDGREDIIVDYGGKIASVLDMAVAIEKLVALHDEDVEIHEIADELARKPIGGKP